MARGPFQTTACRKHVGQDGAALVDLLVGDRQGGQQADDVAVRGVDQQPALQARGDDVRGVDRQVEADHRPQDADVADQVGQLGAKRLEVLAEPLADREPALEQAVGLDRLDRGQRRPAGDRVAAERGGVHPRLERRGDRRPGDHHARGDAAGQRLGAGQDVGRDALVLIGEPLAGAAHAGLHLVEDQEHAVLVAQLPQARRDSRAGGC